MNIEGKEITQKFRMAENTCRWLSSLNHLVFCVFRSTTVTRANFRLFVNTLLCETKPEEILTNSVSVIGKNQLSFGMGILV